MNPNNLLNKIKTQKGKELQRAKRKAKRWIKKDHNSEMLEMMISEVDHFDDIQDEKNQIAFVYVLKQVVAKEGRQYLSFATDFIIANIESESGRLRQAVVRLSETMIDTIFTDEEPLSDKERKVFSEFIDDLLLLLEKHHEERFEKYKTVKNLPPSKFKSIEMLITKVIQPNVNKPKRVYKKSSGMPEWMDCTWKRIPCDKEDCPVCSELDNSPNDENFFERNEALLKVAERRETSQDNTPPPDHFPFYEEVRDWIEKVVNIAQNSKRNNNFWIFTEDAANLFWYLNVLSVKIYRQLCNRDNIKNQREGHLDYKYTQYVLKETIKELKSSLKEIQKCNPNQKKELQIAFQELTSLEEKIFNI